MSYLRYRFYTDTRNTWKAMLSSIAAAEHSIYLEMYILENDATGNDFLSELERKAREGVKVILILDSVGSFNLTRAATERLKSAGGEVLFFSYWFRRTHRKMLIIDDYTVYLGGVNIAGRFALWKDLQVRLPGKRIARYASRSFSRIYHECGGKDPVFENMRPPKLLEWTKLWFIERGVPGRRHALKAYYEERIRAAEHSVVLITPYFIPHRWLVAQLHNAILRGVTVDIILPAHTDHAMIDRINAHFLSLMQRIGANCYLLEEMNHAKAMLIDEKSGIIGSHNIDLLSFDWNAEAGVFFEDAQMVRDLKKIVLGWKSEATPFITIPSVHWYEIVIAGFLRLFQSAIWR